MLAWVLLFLAAAAVVWRAGLGLSDATDALARRYDLGEALGGMVVLAITTNLPEIAIVGAAALRGDLGLALGNILGGIAVQTLVLVLLDGLRRGAPLTCRAAAPELLLEGLLLLLVLAWVVLGHQLPSHWAIGGAVAPTTVLIALSWLAGLALLARLHRREHLPPAGVPVVPVSAARRDWLQLAVAAACTLLAGVALEISSEHLAVHFGLSGALFGATVLAAATALPEVATGIESIRLGDDRMAISDIFGGNAFLPVLLLEAELLAGHPAMPTARPADLYLTALAMVLTAVYCLGLVLRSPRRLFGLGLDSAAVLALYLLALCGLPFVP